MTFIADCLHYSQHRAHSYFSCSAREDPLPLARYAAAAADAALKAREISAKGGGVHDGFSSDGSFGDILKDDTCVRSENISRPKLGTLETFFYVSKK